MKIDVNAWNQTEAADMGGFKRLPAGGYVCRVEAVREDKSRQGNDEIVLRLDIVEGPYAGYFSRITCMPRSVSVSRRSGRGRTRR